MGDQEKQINKDNKQKTITNMVDINPDILLITLKRWSKYHSKEEDRQVD